MDNWNYISKKRKRTTKDDKEEEEEEKDFTKEFRKNGILKEGNITSSNNHIFFYSEVNKTSMYELNTELQSVAQKMLEVGNKYGIDPPPIHLHINSYGGSIFAAMSTIDTIINSPVPVYTIVEGCAASAGTLISVVGAKRFITSHSYMLIHQLSTVFWGKMQEFEDEKENLDNLMKMIKNIYKKHTKVPAKQLDEILKHDLWWDADTCLKYKLIDEIN